MRQKISPSTPTCTSYCFNSQIVVIILIFYIFRTVTTDKNSEEPYSKRLILIQKQASNLPGPPAQMPPDSVLVASTSQTKTVQSVPRSITLPNLALAISKNSARVRCQLKLNHFEAYSFSYSGVTITLSSMVDLKNFNQGGHKIGMALELEA